MSKREDPDLEAARLNLEWWMECYQDQVMEKNHVLNRLRRTEDKEWRSILYRWLGMVEEEMEEYRRAIEHAESIYQEAAGLASGDVHGYGG